MPGLVDCHTHPIFFGSRAREFARRLDGATYQDIAASGGGIRSTVAATRSASDADLIAATLARFERFLAWGVTSLEAKSGYGLSVAEELRLLRILRVAASRTAQHVSSTCLALHALPEGESTRAYVDAMTHELLPEVRRQGLASSVDAFIEAGYFTAAEAAPFLAQAKALGLSIRLHADEFSDQGGAAAAAAWGAASADHLQFAVAEGIQAMAQAKVVAVLLPGTSLYTGIPFTQAKAWGQASCAVAIATDFNPGSSVTDNLPLCATIAAVHCGLSIAQAVAGVTLVPAFALKIHDTKGHLAPGSDADFLMFRELDCVDEWVADLGRHPPQSVFIRGIRQPRR